MLRKELSYYFSTPIAYIVIGLYLLSISLFLWVIPGEWNIVESGYAQVDGLFELSPWLLMLLCPALTMRLFAEERKTGIWDLLLSKRVKISRMVIGKWFAAWILMVIALLPCIVHYFAVAYIAEPMGNLDMGAFAGSFIGLILLSAAFIGIGIFAAVWSKNQIVCFIFGALLSFVLYWLVLKGNYSSLSRGVIDLRDVAMMITTATVGVLGAIGKLEYLR